MYLAQLETKRHNPTAAQTHYTTAHTLYTQLGAAKDGEKNRARMERARIEPSPTTQHHE
jgi:hypothetical protein